MSEFSERFNLARYLLEQNLALRAEKVAVRSRRRSLRYREIDVESAKVQRLLEDLDLRPEQRVLLVLPDVAEFVTAWLGVLKAGAVFAMVNPRLPEDDYRYYLDYSRAPVAFVGEGTLPAFVRAAKGARFLEHVVLVEDGTLEESADLAQEARGLLKVWPLSAALHKYHETIAATSPAGQPFDTHRDDVAGWLFTSGTSGKPKAAIHFHQDFAFNIERYCKQVLNIRDSDVTMAVSKLFFGYATGTNLMFPFACGASTALFPERSTPEALVENAREFHPTVLAAVPTTLNGVLQLRDDVVGDAFSRLRMVISAGEALPAALQKSFEQRFQVEILDGIGSAEMFHIYISNYPKEVRSGSLGRLVPGYECRIVGPTGEDAPPGEVGTLWIKGGSTALGYFLDRDKSRATFHGDTAITGDLFRRDAEGWFYYEGRADDMLKVGGIFVSPREVEECLLQHPAVRECCVVGREDSAGLVTPFAYVVVHSGFKAGVPLCAELQAHVKSLLAAYKFPRAIEFLDALPRNDRGKIARAELRDRQRARGERSRSTSVIEEKAIS